MQSMKILAAAAALSAMVATPVLAQDTVQPRTSIHKKERMAVRHHHRNASMNRSMNSYNRYDSTYSTNRYDPNYGRRDTGFWPGDMAAGIVGGAVGTAGAIAGGAIDTAGAIATAPFRAGPYANNGFYHEGDFACRPGTYFRGQDGLRHLCQ